MKIQYGLNTGSRFGTGFALIFCPLFSPKSCCFLQLYALLYNGMTASMVHVMECNVLMQVSRRRQYFAPLNVASGASVLHVFYIQIQRLYLPTSGAFVPRLTRRDLSLCLIEHALVFVVITISTVCSRPMKVTDYLWLLQQRPNPPLIGTRARLCLSAAMMAWVSPALLQALDYLSIPNRSQTFRGKHTHTLTRTHARTHAHTHTRTHTRTHTHTHTHTHRKFRCLSARNVARMHAVCFIEPIWREKNAHAHTHTHTLYQHLCLGLHGNCIMDLP